MSLSPIITFKAGVCSVNGKKVTPIDRPGYLYLYIDNDEMMHLCWRPRGHPSTEPAEDLLMIPGDGTFAPLLKEQGAEDLHSPTNGRIFALKFSSSGERRYFWMQSKTQHKDGSLSWFSERDQRLGQIVDALLQGEDPSVVAEEIEDLRRGGGGGDDGDGGGGDDDDLMDLDGNRPPEHHRQGSGGAGADATGADPREEGEASREGGADGGRAASGSASSSAPQDTSAIVQNFLRSIQNNPQLQRQQQPQSQPDKPFTTLPDLLSSSTTIPFIDTLRPQQLDDLCAYLPPDLFLLSQESSANFSSAEPSPAAAQAAIAALSPEQKSVILKRVLRSPQLQQSLGSLTVALRDGGLPMIGEALGLKTEGGGLRGSMPLGGGEAVEAFVDGVKRTIEEEGAGEDEGGK